MGKCYIITAYIDGTLTEIISPSESDFIICADGGYEIATSFNIVPHLVIGDADSGGVTLISSDGSKFNSVSNVATSKTEFIRLQTEKDEADTFVCVQHAVALGYDDITIVGGIGGRLDHTVSNIQTLTHFASKTKRVSFTDENNFMTVIDNSNITLPRKEGFSISLFSLSDICDGVTISGVYYPLTNATLTNTHPLGLSNEFIEDEAFIEVKDGRLLVIMSRL